MYFRVSSKISCMYSYRVVKNTEHDKRHTPPFKQARTVHRGPGGHVPPQALGGGGALRAPPLGCLLILFTFCLKLFLKITEFFEFFKNFLKFLKFSQNFLNFLQSFLKFSKNFLKFFQKFLKFFNSFTRFNTF